MQTSRPPASLGTARAIAAALIGGVTTFAMIVWVLGAGEGAGAADAAAGTMLWAWSAVASAAIVAATFVWRTRIVPVIESPRGARGDDPAAVAALQNGLLVVWALLEGAALFGVVVSYVFGTPYALAGGLLLVWLGIGFTFPRSDWFPRATGAD